MVAARADVRDLDCHAARQLTLDVRRKLMDARRSAVLIYVADVRAHTGERARGIAQRLHETVRERVGQRDRGNAGGLRDDRVLRVSDLAVIVRGAVGNRIVPRSPVEPVPAPYDGLAVDRVYHA